MKSLMWFYFVTLTLTLNSPLGHAQEPNFPRGPGLGGPGSGRGPGMWQEVSDLKSWLDKNKNEPKVKEFLESKGPFPEFTPGQAPAPDFREKMENYISALKALKVSVDFRPVSRAPIPAEQPCVKSETSEQEKRIIALEQSLAQVSSKLAQPPTVGGEVDPEKKSRLLEVLAKRKVAELQDKIEDLSDRAAAYVSMACMQMPSRGPGGDESDTPDLGEDAPRRGPPPRDAQMPRPPFGDDARPMDPNFGGRPPFRSPNATPGGRPNPVGPSDDELLADLPYDRPDLDRKINKAEADYRKARAAVRTAQQTWQTKCAKEARNNRMQKPMGNPSMMAGMGGMQGTGGMPGMGGFGSQSSNGFFAILSMLSGNGGNATYYNPMSGMSSYSRSPFGSSFGSSFNPYSASSSYSPNSSSMGGMSGYTMYNPMGSFGIGGLGAGGFGGSGYGNGIFRNY